MSQVALSIYELHGTSALNLLTRAADMGGQCAESCLGHMWSFLEGAYHVGVEAADVFGMSRCLQHVPSILEWEVYWLEWSFGWCEEGSGVYMAGAQTRHVRCGWQGCLPRSSRSKVPLVPSVKEFRWGEHRSHQRRLEIQSIPFLCEKMLMSVEVTWLSIVQVFRVLDKMRPAPPPCVARCSKVFAASVV